MIISVDVGTLGFSPHGQSPCGLCVRDDDGTTLHAGSHSVQRTMQLVAEYATDTDEPITLVVEDSWMGSNIKVTKMLSHVGGMMLAAVWLVDPTATFLLWAPRQWRAQIGIAGDGKSCKAQAMAIYPHVDEHAAEACCMADAVVVWRGKYD